MLHCRCVAPFRVGIHIGKFAVESTEFAIPEIYDDKDLKGSEQLTYIIYRITRKEEFCCCHDDSGEKREKEFKWRIRPRDQTTDVSVIQRINRQGAKCPQTLHRVR